MRTTSFDTMALESVSLISWARFKKKPRGLQPEEVGDLDCRCDPATAEETSDLDSRCGLTAARPDDSDRRCGPGPTVAKLGLHVHSVQTSNTKLNLALTSSLGLQQDGLALDSRTVFAD